MVPSSHLHTQGSTAEDTCHLSASQDPPLLGPQNVRLELGPTFLLGEKGKLRHRDVKGPAQGYTVWSPDSAGLHMELEEFLVFPGIVTWGPQMEPQVASALLWSLTLLSSPFSSPKAGPWLILVLTCCAQGP